MAGATLLVLNRPHFTPRFVDRTGAICSGHVFAMMHRDPPESLEEKLFRDIILTAQDVVERTFGGAACYGTLLEVDATRTPHRGFNVYAAPVVYPPGEGCLSNPAGDHLPLRIAVARLYEWCEWQDGEAWVALSAAVETSDCSCDHPWRIRMWYGPD